MAVEKARCPHCGEPLEKKPARKKKCPHCSKDIYVRGGELLTEEQIEQRACVSRWMGILERRGVSHAMFTDERKKLSQQFGFEAPFRDTVWRVLNTLVAGQTDLLDLETLYLFMGDFVEEEGKDPAPYVQQAMQVMEARIRREVLDYRQLNESGLKWRVVVHTANDDLVCPSCKALADHSFTVDEFLQVMPIPRSCDNPRGCRCEVGATLADA